MAHRFSMLLLALIPRSGDSVDAQFVVHLALTACHPVVSAAERSARARPLWGRIRLRLPAAPVVLAGKSITCAVAVGSCTSWWRTKLLHSRSRILAFLGARLTVWSVLTRCASRHAADPETVVAVLLGEQGAISSLASQRQAGLAALRVCMAEAADALFPQLHARLEAQLQRADHDALSPGDISKWAAPEGVLAAEVGAQNGFVAEVVEDKNVRKVRLFLIYHCCDISERLHCFIQKQNPWATSAFLPQLHSRQ